MDTLIYTKYSEKYKEEILNLEQKNHEPKPDEF